MIARLYSLNKQFINLKGKLLALPKLIKAFIVDALGYGWDRNRAIDNIGTHNNALMGGYLLAASNTVIAITGILTTDTIIPLTSGGNVGTVTVNGTISFTAGSNYGAFEVYRAGTLIGRYCLTERQGLQIINQVTGGLPNGLLGGTTTTVWQRSNAFYCETNHTGYSISGTGWVTNAGVGLTVGTIIPADPLNSTKCMAWVGGVQQDLQFIGKSRNSVSVINPVFYCNKDRYWACDAWGGTVTTHKIRARCVVSSTGIGIGQIYGTGTASTVNRTILVSHLDKNIVGYYPSRTVSFGASLAKYYDRPITVTLEYNNGLVSLSITDELTGGIETVSTQFATGTVTIASYTSIIANHGSATGYKFTGYIGQIEEWADGVKIGNYVPNIHGTTYYNTVNAKIKTLVGISTNLVQNVDLLHNVYNATGYELWTNGTDYQIYPLRDNGARLVTPSGYALVETVTAGNMPSVADSRISTFKYALANSCILRNSVPEAYDATDPCAPKLLTYSELSALSANPKVTKTEADSKITNLTIRQ